MKLLECVLLVDDNRFLNILNIDLIKNLNFTKEVQVVKNGFEALDYLETCFENPAKPIPEIIFLDLIMPELDGLGFLKYFNKYCEKAKSKVFILSSLIKEEIMPELNKLGVDDFIFKPLKEEILINKINTHFPDLRVDKQKRSVVDF